MCLTTSTGVNVFRANVARAASSNPLGCCFCWMMSDTKESSLFLGVAIVPSLHRTWPTARSGSEDIWRIRSLLSSDDRTSAIRLSAIRYTANSVGASGRRPNQVAWYETRGPVRLGAAEVPIPVGHHAITERLPSSPDRSKRQSLNNSVAGRTWPRYQTVRIP